MTQTQAAIEPVSLTICRKFEATPDELYAAFTDPALLTRWMGPGSMRVVEAIAEAHVGGRYMVHMQDSAADGSDEAHVVHGVFKELVPGVRVVQTWRWQSSDVETRLTLEFREVSARVTELTLTHERFLDTEVRDKHEFGWSACLEKLAGIYPFVAV